MGTLEHASCRLRGRSGWSLGLHGAVLPLLLMPAAVALARLLDVFTIQWQFALPMAPIGMAIYYLAWNDLVGFLNCEVRIGSLKRAGRTDDRRPASL